MFEFLLEAAAEGTEQASLLSMLSFPLMLGVIILMFFLMNRSQRKAEKEQKAMRDALEVGDEVTTIGGIIGEIVSIKGDTVTVETSKAGTKIRFHRSAIQSVDVSAKDKKASAEAN